ncbi:MAG: DinB family protein [Bacteroidetes bacterium]|nr:DinB family protein [Bacteroidota bacterium]
MISSRENKMHRYGSGFVRLTDELKQVPKEAIDWRSKKDVWSINEIVIHLADLEAGAYVNFRRAVAEPTQRIFAFDKDLWAEGLPYYSQSHEASLKLFRILRASNYLLLKNLEEDAWLHTIYYEGHGQISLEDLLDLYDKHLDKAIHEVALTTELYSKMQGK